MPVTFDAKATADVNTNAVSTITNNNITVGGTANLLVAALHFSTASVPAGLAVTWNGVSMTAVPGGSATDATFDTTILYYLINPATGNHALTASWTPSCQCVIYGVSWIGANPAGGSATFPRVSSNNFIGSTPATATLSGADTTNSAALCAFSSKGNFGTPSNTSLYSDTGGAIISAAACYAVPAVTSAMTCAISSGTQDWSSVAIEIAQPSAAVVGGSTFSLMGVGRRQSLGWSPLLDHRRRVFRPRPRGLLSRRAIILPLKKAV